MKAIEYTCPFALPATVSTLLFWKLLPTNIQHPKAISKSIAPASVPDMGEEASAITVAPEESTPRDCC